MTEGSPGLAPLKPLLELLFEGADSPTPWRKCIVTPVRRKNGPTQKLTASPVRLSRGQAVKLVTSGGKSERTVTVDPADWPARLLEAIEAGPCHLEVLAKDHDWHARRTRDGRWLVTRSRPSLAMAAEAPAHNRPKSHALPVGDERVQRLFIETGLYGKNGQLLGESAGKFRQVQHYIELLRHMPVWTEGATVRVVDAGCGKAYLSLSLCLWAELNGMSVRLDGVDASEDVIGTATQIAEGAGLSNTYFHAQSISQFASGSNETADVLLSLHACDTATDEALAAGVKLNAKAIVLVPCCHHELVAQIEAGRKSDTQPAAVVWNAALGSGLLRHRLADIVTDSLRAAALEALGYTVDVLEFVTPEATARNLMIRASKRPGATASKHAFERYRALADEWAVRPALEDLLGPFWPPAPS